MDRSEIEEGLLRKKDTLLGEVLGYGYRAACGRLHYLNTKEDLSEYEAEDKRNLEARQDRSRFRGTKHATSDRVPDSTKMAWMDSIELTRKAIPDEDLRVLEAIYHKALPNTSRSKGSLTRIINNYRKKVPSNNQLKALEHGLKRIVQEKS